MEQVEILHAWGVLYALGLYDCAGAIGHSPDEKANDAHHKAQQQAKRRRAEKAEAKRRARRRAHKAAQSSVRRAASTARAPVAPTPTYDTVCAGTGVEPGTGAHEPMSSDFLRAWIHIGGVIAGCAQPAEKLPATSGYLVRGLCDGRPWSLAVASAGYPAEVLVDDAARFAQRFVDDKTLVGASERTQLGQGDFQIVATSAGS